MNSPNRPTFIIKTFGCKVNQYETQAMRESLKKEDFLEEKNPKDADYCIINSCTVTKKSDKEARNLIRNFHRLNPNSKIVVVGCYAESKQDREKLLAIPGVFTLVKNNEK